MANAYSECQQDTELELQAATFISRIPNNERQLTSNAQPPKASTQPSNSRWHRPRLYLTIVALYLLASILFVLSTTVIGVYHYRDAVAASPPPNSGLAGLSEVIFLVILLPWLAILAILSLIAAIRLLLSKGKRGIVLSLVALVLMGVTFPVSFAYYTGNVLNLDPDEYLSTKVAHWAAIGLSVFMVSLWILGWKGARQQ